MKIKISIIFFIIAGLLLLITIAPYMNYTMSIVGLEVGGIKVFAKDISERNTVLIFLTIASTLLGAYFYRKGN